MKKKIFYTTNTTVKVRSLSSKFKIKIKIKIKCCRKNKCQKIDKNNSNKKNAEHGQNMDRTLN